MKTLTAAIVAAALITPAAAHAARHATPGQSERHAENLKADEADQTERRASNDRQARDRVPAAKAGKVTVAPAAPAASGE